MAFAVLTIILLIIILVIIYFWNQRKFIEISRKLPGPLAWPIFGNALDFACKDEDLFERINSVLKNFPSPMRLWFGPKLVIVFTKPEQVEKIMTSQKFVDKDSVYRFIQIFNGEGLISGSGQKWKNDKRLMSPMFLKKNITQYYPVFLKHTNTLVKILECEIDKPSFNVIKYIHKCSADFVNETLLGTSTDYQLTKGKCVILDEISRMYTIVHARIVKVWLQIECLYRFTSYYREQEYTKKKLHIFMGNALEEARRKHIPFDNNSDRLRTFLDYILDIKIDFPNFATDLEIIHHLITLYSASQDTVSTVCSFTLVLLGMYPEIQNKVQKELQEVIRDSELKVEDISKLTYLDMCLKDVLRLFPIAPYIMRSPNQDVKVDDLLIPKGCSVAMAIYLIHTSPELWEKPTEFYPEHFLEKNVAKRHPYAFLPFSAGQRACLGKPYAYLAMKTLLVKVLQNYKIEAEGKLEDKELKSDISVRFKDDQYVIRIKKL